MNVLSHNDVKDDFDEQFENNIQKMIRQHMMEEDEPEPVVVLSRFIRVPKSRAVACDNDEATDHEDERNEQENELKDDEATDYEDDINRSTVHDDDDDDHDHDNDIDYGFDDDDHCVIIDMEKNEPRQNSSQNSSQKKSIPIIDLTSTSPLTQPYYLDSCDDSFQSEQSTQKI